MTAAVHGPRVTQEDRKAASDLWDATDGLWSVNFEQLADVLARHREASQEELRSALFELLDCLGVMSGHDFELEDYGIGPLRCAEMRRLARTDATGEGA